MMMPRSAAISLPRTKIATEELAEKLAARGLAAAAINGDIEQKQRERIIQQLKDGRIDVLVATDVAARGIDIPAEHLWTSALATADFLAAQLPGGSAYVIGEAGLTTAMHEAGYTLTDVAPDFVVLGETLEGGGTGLHGERIGAIGPAQGIHDRPLWGAEGVAQGAMVPRFHPGTQAGE